MNFLSLKDTTRETLQGLHGPELAIPTRLHIVRQNLVTFEPLVEGMNAVRQPVSMGHNYDNPAYRQVLDSLAPRAVEPVTRPMLRLVKDTPRPQNLLKEELVIDQVLFDQLAAKEEVAPVIAPVVQDIPTEPVIAIEAASLDEAQAKLNALRSEINESSIPTKEAYADLTKAA